MFWHPALVAGGLRLVDDPDDADGGFVGGLGVDAAGHPVEPFSGAVIVVLCEESGEIGDWKALKLVLGLGRQKRWIQQAYLASEGIQGLLSSWCAMKVHDNKHAQIGSLFNNGIQVL